MTVTFLGLLPEPRAQKRVAGSTTSTECGRLDQWQLRRPGILKTTPFFALGISLSVSLVMLLKKHPAAARLLEVVSVDRPMKLANEDYFNDECLIC